MPLSPLPPPSPAELFWQKYKFYLLLTLLSLTWLSYLGQFDQEWTWWLRENRSDLFGEWMGRTLFEGSLPGGSDPAILFILASFLLYFRAWKSNATERLQEWRPFLGYIITTTLAGGLGYVHCLKWIIGRARPNLVWDKQWPFSEWYEFGPHYIAEGIYRGSFPSGHTAVVLVPMLLSLIWLTDFKYRKPKLAIFWAIGCILLAVGMAVARSMTAHHWISDSLGIFGPVALIAYWLYFDFLKVPQQRAYFRRNKKLPEMPRLWELKLCGWGFLVILGLICWFWGLRSVQLQSVPYLLGLAPAGAVLMTWGFLRIQRLYSGLFKWLHH